MRRLWLLRLPSLDVLEIYDGFILSFYHVSFVWTCLNRSVFYRSSPSKNYERFPPMEIRRRSLDEIVCEIFFFFFFFSFSFILLLINSRTDRLCTIDSNNNVFIFFNATRTNILSSRLLWNLSTLKLLRVPLCLLPMFP